ncbi:BRCT domain-containing DNA repair protein [Actinidia rufa]|uniref:BRCT domain-containing DNA repair protein n=1 Tax=Actinidia rufa TaxID=165716 RepID=A0A7J0FEZ8_9ERIC|nr:BRCT domain-containing DNA repair protein [Actinidia rufa]
MSDSNANPSNVANQKVRRNLPSWMSSRENESESHGKKLDDVDEHEEDDGSKTPKQVKDCDKQRSGSTPSKKTESNRKLSPSSFGATNFSKLLEGVVFVLSGFVNPERSILRSQALEMGADYQPDWNSNCTLLVCAFSNTPKFRQVETDCGTIISKSGASNPAKEFFSSSKVKKWAIDDLEKTISWLESQEEKPEASEIKKIAAEGILTCLQDAIDSLKQKQDVQQMTEQWNFIPRVVEELAKLEGTAKSSVSLSKEELCREAMSCKQIYEVELGNVKDDSLVKKKKPRTDESKKNGNDKTKAVTGDAAAYDSDETIEMTEEEIDLAYNTVASKLSKS